MADVRSQIEERTAELEQIFLDMRALGPPGTEDPNYTQAFCLMRDVRRLKRRARPDIPARLIDLHNPVIAWAGTDPRREDDRSDQHNHPTTVRRTKHGLHG